ncbi:hypothetical protein BaRGS_00007956 [Batillaria attramentaria]|uniref:Uncharacterized protein n=1 Tax=Batillaria attramentaria TaxID=370345 RepID=A0ABD0LNT6_9CAEN
MQPTLTALAVVALAVCLPPTPAQGTHTPQTCEMMTGTVNKGDKQRWLWRTEWPPASLGKLKKSIKNVEKQVKNHEKCSGVFKPPNEDCSSYAECRRDAISRTALLLCPLQAVEKSIEENFDKKTASRVKGVRRKLSKMLKRASKDCKAKSAGDEGFCKCKLDADVDWKECEEYMKAKNLTSKDMAMIVTEKLKDLLGYEWRWGVDWHDLHLSTLRRQCSDFKKEAQKTLSKNKHCKKLFKKPNYCCKSYSHCKQDVARRLQLFVKPLEVFKNGTTKDKLVEHLARVVGSVEDFVKNVTKGQCQRGDGSKKVKNPKPCKTKDDKKCWKFVETLSRENYTVFLQETALFMDKLEEYVQLVDLSVPKQLCLAKQDKAESCGKKKPKPGRETTTKDKKGKKQRKNNPSKRRNRNQRKRKRREEGTKKRHKV